MKNEYLISLFIDNELDLNEKITFVETVHEDRSFTDETVSLLQQEKKLHSLPVDPLLALPPFVNQRECSFNAIWRNWWKPLAGLMVTGALASMVFFVFSQQPSKPGVLKEPHRFVLYLPEVDEAKIMGTFTDWHPVAMTPVGTSGYWTITLEIPEGEHRYSCLIGKDRQIVDPTVTLREQDDFGGENSVLEVRRATI